MNAGSVGERAAATNEARPSGKGFAQELARAEKRYRPERTSGSAKRVNPGNEPTGRPQPLALARMAPRDAMLRRRREADAKDGHLVERRGVDRATHLETERVVTTQAEVRPEPPAAARLAAAVERLELALERQQRAEGPSLEMQFGGRLRIRLTRGHRGLELAISGDAAAARLARAELPGLLARLRQRGLTISRAEVRARPSPEAAVSASADTRVDASAGVR
jgi:hypothetical protein